MGLKNWLKSLEYNIRAHISEIAEDAAQVHLRITKHNKLLGLKQRSELWEKVLQGQEETYRLSQQRAVIPKTCQGPPGDGEVEAFFESAVIEETPVVYDQAFLDTLPQINTLQELEQFTLLSTFRRFVLFGEWILMACDFLVYG